METINTRITIMLAIHLLAIVVASGVLMMATENAFAEPNESSNANSHTQAGGLQHLIKPMVSNKTGPNQENI